MESTRVFGLLVGFAAVLGAASLAPAAALAGVPAACVEPAYHPIECPRELRRQYLKVLSSARIRELRRQRADLERQVPPQTEERNQLLREIRDTLRDRRRRR